ncbi:hypothetical protein LT679_16925 [Mucilaginibacter roseus]|uniref:Lipoprotein n=1 Tax=Mucilaginibacter roseus TaxID=1528868 RepID=A0ABS8U7T0_9SPHI|nr:hypothetical protein [Mucilaginibacter roseus]MCD8742295.1 hypothetical protein [Mucilaginibacter roseus]
MLNKAFTIGLSFIVLVLSACTRDQPFNRKLWNDAEGLDFKYRDGMLNDLLKNRKIKGMRFYQVTDSLGWPQGKKDNYIYYDIDVKYDGYPPSYIKRLYVYFKDSVAVSTRIYEHTEKKKKK